MVAPSLVDFWCMLCFHPFPLFKWHHSRLHSWKSQMLQFCACFQILSVTSLLSVPALLSRNQLLLDHVSFAPGKVEPCLATLDSNSATGPDGISSHVLKACSALAHPLCTLFTLSFALSHLPSAWKWANITSLHKKGAKTTDLFAYFQSSARSWNPSSQLT